MFKRIAFISLLVGLSSCSKVVQQPVVNAQTGEDTALYQVLAYVKYAEVRDPAITNQLVANPSTNKEAISSFPVYDIDGKSVSYLNFITDDGKNYKSVQDVDVNSVSKVVAIGKYMERPVVSFQAGPIFAKQIVEQMDAGSKLVTTTGSDIYITKDMKNFVSESGKKVELSALKLATKRAKDALKYNNADMNKQWQIVSKNKDTINEVLKTSSVNGNISVQSLYSKGYIKPEISAQGVTEEQVCHSYIFFSKCYTDFVGTMNNWDSFASGDGLGGGYHQYPYRFGHPTVKYTIKRYSLFGADEGNYEFSLDDPQNGGWVGCPAATAGNVLWWYWKRGSKFFSNVNIPSTGKPYDFKNASSMSKRVNQKTNTRNFIHDDTSILYQLFKQNPSGAPYLTEMMDGQVFFVGNSPKGVMITGEGWTKGLQEFLDLQRNNLGKRAVVKSAYQQIYLSEFNNVGAEGDLAENFAYLVRQQLRKNEPVVAMYVNEIGKSNDTSIASGHFSPIVHWRSVHNPFWHHMYFKTVDSALEAPDKELDMSTSSWYVKGVSAIEGL